LLVFEILRKFEKFLLYIGGLVQHTAISP